MVSKGLATTSPNSFIDNFGIITRSNLGMYQTDLPVRNDVGSYHSGVLDLKSDLWVSGWSQAKTANYSVDQEGGQTILENGATLKVTKSLVMNAGELLTYGGATTTISVDTSIGSSIKVTGGTIKVSADNPALYGKLSVVGGMLWTGGTFEAYVNGAQTNQQTQLAVTSGNVTLGAGAHLHMNWQGNLTSGLTWTPISVEVAWQIENTLTFDNPDQFTIAYNPQSRPTSIQVTAR